LYNKLSPNIVKFSCHEVKAYMATNVPPNNAAINVRPAPVSVNATVPPAAIANSGKLLANAVKSANEISKGLNSVAAKLSTAANALKKNESKIATAVVNAVQNSGPSSPGAKSPGGNSSASDPASPQSPVANSLLGNNPGSLPHNNVHQLPAAPAPAAAANGNLVNVNLSGPGPAVVQEGLGGGRVVGGNRSTLMAGTRKAIRSIVRMIGGLRQTAVSAATTVSNGVKAVNSMANTVKKNVTLKNVKAVNTIVANTLPAVANKTNSVLKSNVVPPVKVNAKNGAPQVNAVQKAATQVMNATKSKSGGRRQTRRRR